ncbi:MAG: sensor histidine kinase [Clostridiales Family XIII bacterium]|jgi:signal transduction histidine kinase|nr:sensor histidine kinase [Clostridiales Family XIII bacterium]
MEKTSCVPGKRSVFMVFAALLTMFVICMAIWTVRVSLPVIDVFSETGVWDLRDFDFTKRVARFSGAVEYIPDALLSPQAFEERAGEATPVDTFGSGSRAGTSRMRLLVPDGFSYAISESIPLGSSRVFVNGNWMEDIGAPDEGADHPSGGDAFFYYTATPVNAEIEIVQQITNYVHRKIESHAGYVIGTPAMMRAFFSRNLVTAGMCMGIIILLMLVHLSLWLFFDGQRINIYCLLLCVFMLLYSAIVGGNVLISMFPWIPWRALFTIEYVCSPAIVLLLLKTSDSVYPGVVPKPFFTAVAALSAAFMLSHLLFDTLFISRLMTGYFVLIVVTISYVFVRMLLLSGKTDFAQKIFLAGSAIFAYSGIRDILFYMNIFIPPYSKYANDPVVVIALPFIIYVQMLAMLFNNAHIMNESREQEQNLRVEKVALERTNTLRKDLMAKVAHELRTPLAVMSGYAELISHEMAKSGMDEQAQEDIGVISSEAMRLSHMLDEALKITVSHKETPRNGAIAMDGVLEQIVRLYRPILAHKGTSIDLRVPGNLPAVCGNEGEMTQIMYNLLSNASKHTEDGHILVSAERVSAAGSPGESPAAQASCAGGFVGEDDGGVADERIEVRVSDTGTGIRPEILPHVFTQGAYEGGGYGLGLVVCKEIVTSHGGDIRIESEPGKGTTVRFTLPVPEEGAENA